jgi:hypothetical protein
MLGTELMDKLTEFHAVVGAVAVVDDDGVGAFDVGQHRRFERVEVTVAEQVVGVELCTPPAGTCRLSCGPV